VKNEEQGRKCWSRVYLAALWEEESDEEMRRRRHAETKRMWKECR
jgi:hypothetical protein